MFSGILQPSHLILILIVALVFLGPKRLPDAGRALGQGLKEFRSSIGSGHDDAPERAVPAAAAHEDESSAHTTRS
jgi:sec-independent protein translocase protein TatA